MLGPWRKGSANTAAVETLYDLSASHFGTTRNIHGDMKPHKMPQWRVRVLKANFLHLGAAPEVGSEITIEADLAADLIERKLCELISKPAPRPRDPRSTW